MGAVLNREYNGISAFPASSRCLWFVGVKLTSWGWERKAK